ncbi:uncharacterized protein OCT59_011350 [Rhizophagus irregularis]|uniref:uncharacterized protein n=1 Tax=Rhizophagus irregularis TaxID=588596 RepID=UPI000CC8F632|nr:hypothetical protein OCT59_011350 [Rhizophagus irregularis]
MIFVNCQQLESIRTSSGSRLSGKRLLEFVAKYSPKNFHELNLREVNLKSKDHLESFFSSWKDRIPLKPLSLIINGNGKGPLNNNIIRKLVEKYKGLGVIKNLSTQTNKSELDSVILLLNSILNHINCCYVAKKVII